MFINITGSIGQIIEHGTQNVTGSLFITLFLVLIVLIVIAMMFTIPLEFISILILPFCISTAAYYGNFVAPVAIIIIYVATIITKNWIFK